MVSVINLQHFLICLSNWLDERGEENDHVKECENNLRYRSSVADRLQQTNGSLPFPFSVCIKQTDCGIPETWRHGNMET
jgi:hypothetical protein